MHNLPDTAPSYVFDAYLGYGERTQSEDIDNWATAALPEFADLIERSFRNKFPHIVTHAKFGRAALIAHLCDALTDAVYDIQKDLENE
jgi:hypothetical protein